MSRPYITRRHRGATSGTWKALCCSQELWRILESGVLGLSLGEGGGGASQGAQSQKGSMDRTAQTQPRNIRLFNGVGGAGGLSPRPGGGGGLEGQRDTYLGSGKGNPHPDLHLKANQVKRIAARPRLRVPRGGGGMAAWAPPPDPPTHPHQKFFLQEKNDIYQRGPRLEVDFKSTPFFFGL